MGADLVHTVAALAAVNDAELLVLIDAANGCYAAQRATAAAGRLLTARNVSPLSTRTSRSAAS